MLIYWIISTILSLLVLRQLAKMAIRDDDEWDFTAPVVFILLSFVPFINTIIMLFIIGFMINHKTKHMKNEDIREFWRRVFLIKK